MQWWQTVEVFAREHIPVRTLLHAPLPLEPLTGELGLENPITDKGLHRPQLLLAGYTDFFTPQRVQIVGNTEFYYLRSLPPTERHAAIDRLLSFPIPCIVFTNGNRPEESFVRLASSRGIALLRTPYDTTKTIAVLSEFLHDQFAPRAVVHGTFVDVYGVGILFVGRSGIGKSELALELVSRGHRLVADDVVVLTKKRESVLIGTSTKLTHHLLEIRGLGIVDIRHMFGIRAVRSQKRLDIIVELEEWDRAKTYERLGLDQATLPLLGVDIAAITLPIVPGKPVAAVAEAVALHHLLQMAGFHAARELSERLDAALATQHSPLSQEATMSSAFHSDEE
jgi:HPr kinase/phosphorylase